MHPLGAGRSPTDELGKKRRMTQFILRPHSILKSGVPINDLVSLALTYSGHKLKSKNLLAMLTNGSRFTRDSHFEQLAPIYAVTAQEIEDYIKFCLL